MTRLLTAIFIVGFTVFAVIGGSDSDPNTTIGQEQPRPTTVSGIDHVIWIWFENRDSTAITAATAPTFTNFASTYVNFTNFFGITHPSEPNYLAAFSGSTQGVTDDGHYSFPASVDNLAKQLAAAGKSWRLYAQNLPSVCFDGDTSTNGIVDGPGVTGRYDRKHVPAMSFESVRLNPAECANIQRLANFDPLVNFSFIAPNEINNMHDGTTAQGDAFLAAFLPLVTNSPDWTHTLLIVSFDEGSPGNHIYTAAGAPWLAHSNVGTLYNHYNVLRTVETIYGLPFLGGAATATTMTELFPPAVTPTNTATNTPTFTATPTNTATPTFTPTSTLGPPHVFFNNKPYTVNESQTASIDIFRSGNLAQPTTVNFQTSNGTAVGGAACTSGVDYISVSQSVTFMTGENMKNVNVTACGDVITESPETLNLTLTGAAVDPPGIAVLTINDVAPPTATTTNTATPTPTVPPAVSGTVTYGNAIGNPNPRFVSNVTITAAGSPTFMTTTAAPGATAGQYSLTGFGSGSYTITPTKTGGVNGITSNDAARIAEHVAGISVLTGNQFVVADVSGNGTVSSNDAAQIARYVASLGPPIGSTATWKFTPVNRTYSSITGDLTGQDFSALLMGEVSGNWTNSGAKPANSFDPNALAWLIGGF